MPKSIKASAGSVLYAPLRKLQATLNDLISPGAPTSLDGKDFRQIYPENLVALDGAGENIFDFEWPESLRLILGEEGPGLPHLLNNLSLIRIPTQQVESLNATVAASIAMFHYRQRHKTSGQ